MPELKDVLGSVLRDVAHSRVTGDLFSRDVSLDYAKDAVLAAFPVPRVEIKEASIQLRFAVNGVQQTEPDRSGIVGAQAVRHADLIARAVADDFVAKHPRSAEIGKLIEEKGLDLRKSLSEVVANAVKSDARSLDAAIKGEPQALIDRISADVSRKLLEDLDVRRELTRGARVAEVRAAVRVPIDAAVNTFVADLGLSLDSAKRQATRIDVAVTRAELAQVPEPLVSHVSVVLQFRNYQWSEVEGEGGEPVRRLNPE